MESARIKNIIIIILLLLNVVLLFIVMEREAQDARSRQAARQSAIAVIQSGGITLQDATVPRNMELKPMLFVRDLEQERKLATELLGKNVAVDVRGGDVYRYYNEAGWIQFHRAGEFSAGFAEKTFPTESQPVAEHAAQVLSLLGFSGRLMQDNVRDGSGTVMFRQELDGVPVLNCQVILRYQNGRLTGIEDGRRLTGLPEEDTGKTTVTVATALMKLFNGLRELGDIYSEISSISPAYSLSVDISGPARLTPVWYVKTDTGTYQLDTTGGELSRMTERSGILYPELDLMSEPTHLFE